MRGYTAWLARMLALGRVDAAGLRLRLRRAMISEAEYRALERICARAAVTAQARAVRRWE